MKKIVKIAVLMLFAGGVMISCKKDKTANVSKTNYDVKATLTGAAESQPNASTATGNFTGSYSKSSKELSFSLFYSGITATDWHIHKGDPGVSGPVEISLNPVVASPLTKTVILTQSQEDDLLEGKYYVNIHSMAYPAGEIRGQLSATAIVTTGNNGY